MNLIEQIHALFTIYLHATFPLAAQAINTASFTLNCDETKEAFGDINSNSAMLIGKALQRNPRDIATIISNQFTHAAVSSIEIAGPGFLNFFLHQSTFYTLTNELIQKDSLFFKPNTPKKLNVCIEFVSANPTGPLHFGHGRGGIIGDALGNILRFIGHEVTKEFYINDAGAQIAKLALSFKIRCLQALGHTIELPEEAYHGTYLITCAQECVQQYGASLTTYDDAFFAHYAKEYMLSRLQVTLTHFGITFDSWFSEKILHDSGLITQALSMLEKKGYLFDADGAQWFRSTLFGDDKDRVVRKASGELTYVAADIAYLKNKVDRGYNSLIMILGHDHHSYVVRLQAVQQALGLTDYPLTIILYQLVKMKEEGTLVRMSKRAGNIITLDDVIETVGTDVARFFYLQRKADAQLDFDLALALTHSDENPVYYIQYAYVRTKSILEKAERENFDPITEKDCLNIGPSEALLIKKIVSLKSLIAAIATDYQTHALAQFALDLATTFHRYYSKNRVVDPAKVQESRGKLAVVTIVGTTLKTVLTLLGISCPERM